MERQLILLAGYPGTGKSYLAHILMQRFPELVLLSPDAIKEKYWDQYGFDTAEEKELLIYKSWEEYYIQMEDAFSKAQSVISEYPFSGKQKVRIEELCRRHSYQVCTVRLTGDIRTLYERQRDRDMDCGRHPGHIFSTYHKGKGEYHNGQADGLLDYPEFYRRCTTRGYGEFSIGRTWEIDVSDYSRVDYEELIRELEEEMEKHRPE